MNFTTELKQTQRTKSFIDQTYLVLDYETFSEAELKKVGAWKYAKHPSTKFLCIGFRVGTKTELRIQLALEKGFAREHPDKENPYSATVFAPTLISKDEKTKDAFQRLCYYLSRSNVKVVAHNAFFEQCISRFLLPPKIAYALRDPDRWICTAAMAASLALPRNLEGACSALGLPVQKDMEGRRVMLKYCKPRKPTKHDPRTRHNDLKGLRRVMKYNGTDVDAETYLLLAIPELNETERKVWLLDQKINSRGFEIDTALVDKTLSLISEEMEFLNKKTRRITSGAIGTTNQRNKLLAWVNSHGGNLPDLRAGTVSNVLDSPGALSESARTLLEIRRSASRSSTAKYKAFSLRADDDKRIRDVLVYHAASTGRWSGSGVQPQNFPRGTIKNTTQGAEIILQEDLSLLRLLYGDPMALFSSCLRSVIVASKEKELFCADYASIETRVLFWIARHGEGLRAYQENRDLYRELAAVIYNIDHLENVTKLQREVGKRAILGCGYNMGWKNFKETCKTFGNLDISEDLSKLAVHTYRSTHYPIPILWKNIERAAIQATIDRGKKFTINRTSWWVKDDFLWCQLPSGRKLAYYKPELREKLTPWKQKVAVLYHWQVHPKTKKWECLGTYGGRLVENVVQAIARDLMAEAMLRIEPKGYEILLSVHDELLAEKEIGRGSVSEFENLMGELPAWAEGLPMKVEGWKGPRYRK